MTTAFANRFEASGDSTSNIFPSAQPPELQTVITVSQNEADRTGISQEQVTSLLSTDSLGAHGGIGDNTWEIQMATSAVQNNNVSNELTTESQMGGVTDFVAGGGGPNSDLSAIPGAGVMETDTTASSGTDVMATNNLGLTELAGASVTLAPFGGETVIVDVTTATAGIAVATEYSGLFRNDLDTSSTNFVEVSIEVTEVRASGFPNVENPANPATGEQFLTESTSLAATGFEEVSRVDARTGENTRGVAIGDFTGNAADLQTTGRSSIVQDDSTGSTMGSVTEGNRLPEITQQPGIPAWGDSSEKPLSVDVTSTLDLYTGTDEAASNVTAASTGERPRLSGGEIAAIVICSIIGAAAIVLLVVCLLNRSKRKSLYAISNPSGRPGPYEMMPSADMRNHR
jgi:hypothetical protein